MTAECFPSLSYRWRVLIGLESLCLFFFFFFVKSVHDANGMWSPHVKMRTDCILLVFFSTMIRFKPWIIDLCLCTRLRTYLFMNHWWECLSVCLFGKSLLMWIKLSLYVCVYARPALLHIVFLDLRHPDASNSRSSDYPYVCETPDISIIVLIVSPSSSNVCFNWQLTSFIF